MTGATRFIVAGTQRTGTTLLRTSLNSHPQVACHGEVFKLGRTPYALPDGYRHYTRATLPRRMNALIFARASIRAFLDEMFSEADRAAIGFKLMLSHCKSRPDVWDVTKSFAPRVILVTRRNVLKTLVSRRAAASSGVYHISRSLPVKTAVTEWSVRAVPLDPSTIIRDLDAIAGEPAEWRAMISSLPHVEVVYEDYVRDQPAWNARLAEFLGVPSRDLHSDLKKISSDRLREAIANFDEVAAVLAGSRYAPCLETAA